MKNQVSMKETPAKIVSPKWGKLVCTGKQEW